MKPMNQLGNKIPGKKALVVRNIKQVTQKQRELTLKETEYSMFSFPSDLLVLDFLSDSGTTTMTDMQWSSLFYGDESYGRNRGYYVLLDAIRDTFERGNNPNKLISLIQNDESDINELMSKIYLNEHKGGLVNGGIYQLKRPNAFIVPQGRCAEFLLFSTLSEILIKNNSEEYFIPNNGHFDTTEANIAAARIHPINVFSKYLFDDFPVEKIDSANPFKGNMDTEKLINIIKKKTPERIPLIYLTITNNTAAGQPVSLDNIKKVAKIANDYDIPLFFDACRFAENAYFIKRYETGYEDKTIREIIQEMFKYCDGFTISFKKDGLANMGGGLFFRDKGVFHSKYSTQNQDIGIKLKERQILDEGVVSE